MFSSVLNYSGFREINNQTTNCLNSRKHKVLIKLDLAISFLFKD